MVSYGEIRGTVETLQRRQHRFTLYEDLFDHGVVFRLQPEQEEMMRQFWGREVVVQGEIERDATTHRPVEVRSVDTIQLLGAVPPGSYERARGILPSARRTLSTCCGDCVMPSRPRLIYWDTSVVLAYFNAEASHHGILDEVLRDIRLSHGAV